MGVLETMDDGIVFEVLNTITAISYLRHHFVDSGDLIDMDDCSATIWSPSCLLNLCGGSEYDPITPQNRSLSV